MSFLILLVSSPTHSLTYILMSNATWSFLLRAVWSFLPTSPTLWVRTCSMNMCTSSQERSKSSLPLSISSAMPAKPSTKISASVCVIMPCLPSITACAILPAISCLYILLSKAIEELKSSAILSVIPLVLPAQSFAILSPIIAKSLSTCERLLMLYFLFFASTIALTLIGNPYRLINPALSCWL